LITLARSSPEQRLHDARLAIVVIIVLVGAALWFYAIDREALWTDEAITLRYAELPLSRLWGEALDTNPPLYYTLQKFWSAWFGRSEAALRSLSAVLGSATIVLVYVLGRSLAGTGAGLLGALLLATSALHIEYSQEARAYALLAAASTAVIAGVVYVLDRPDGAGSPRPGAKLDAGDPIPAVAWGAYVIGSIAGLYAHNTAVLLFILSSGVLCCWWAIPRHFNRRLLRHWLVATLIVLTTWSWWWPVIIDQTGTELRDFWLEAPSLTAALDTAANVYGQIYIWHAQPFVTSGYVALGVLGSIRLFLRKPWPATFLAVIFVGGPALTYVVSLYRPIFMLRTILWPLPAFLTLVAIGVATLPSRRLLIAAISFIIGVQGVALANYYGYPVKSEPWDELVEIIRSNTPRPAAALLCAADGGIPFSYYAARSELLMPMRGIVVPNEPKWRLNILRAPVGQVLNIEPSDIVDFTAPFSAVWLIERLCHASVAVSSELDKHYSLIETDWLGGLKLSLFRREP
jgi:mannosyltransferase